MYPYPKLRAGCRYQWSADGRTLHLFDDNTRRAFRLSRPMGQLLCRLDGWTQPGRSTGLSAKTIYRYLCVFARPGLLQEPDRILTAPGTLLVGVPCPGLRKGTRSAALVVFSRLVDLLWLPAVVLLLLSLHDLPRIRAPLPMAAVYLSLVPITLLNLAVHEWAHAAAANAHGIPVSAFGLGIQTGLPCAFTSIPLLPYAPRHVRRAVIRAGPFSNLCLGCILLLLLLEVPLFRHELVLLDAIINLFQGLINLLPLEGLDGYAILCTFPSLKGVLEAETSGSRRRRDAFLEQSAGFLLRFLVRIGLPVYLCYEGLSLLTLILEVFLS